MQVHIIGPNLIDQSKGSFHVHAEGCADVTRNPEYRLPDFANDLVYLYDVTSRIDAAEQVYSDQIGEGDMTAADGVNDLWFAPCTDSLPILIAEQDDEDESPAVQFGMEHDGDYHRVQIDGNDLISIQDNGDGTAAVIVFDSSNRHANTAWTGTVKIDGHLPIAPAPEGALPIGTYVVTKTWGYRGRITEAHGSCPEGAAWRMGQTVPLTGVYADGGGTWYSVLLEPAGAVCVTADNVEVVEPFPFTNPWADKYFTD